MSKRFWLLGLVGLVVAALLMACGTGYNSSSDGLVVVGSQGSAVLETFAFALNNGSVAPIDNTPVNTSTLTCVLNGIPSSIVMEPSGAYAFAILQQDTSCPGSATGILAFQISSDGNITSSGSLVSFANEAPGVPVVPNTITIDAAGKFVFVADRATMDPTGLPVPGAISVFAVGSGGSLTEVPGSPFFTPSGVEPLNSDIINVAPSPTVFPNVGINGTQNSVCSIPGSTPPTAEYLYAVDNANYGVWEFQVNTSTGALGIPPLAAIVPFFATDKVPVGVSVDPCDRFVYVSDFLTNKISAYQICIVAITPEPCPYADGSLVPISGSPFTLAGSANGPGPLLVDPYGNNLYVLGTLSNTISLFKISQISGSLSEGTVATVATGQGPVAMAIRQDDSWLFVTNYGTQTLGGTTVSQYLVAPASGALTVLPVIQTDNYPYGIAVK